MSGESAPVSVLLVDDEEVIRELARAVLERAGLHVLDEAPDGVIALERWHAQSPPDRPLVVLLDNRMPGLSGLEVAERMLGEYPTQLVVLFSAHLDRDIVDRAKGLGVRACVPKQDVIRLPGILDELVRAS
jgi:two-component system, chemotaxis family, chemotaxis protein CheY